jgi:uncharacterized membrane protein YjdF
MAAAIGTALLFGNHEFVFYIVVMVVLIAAVCAVHFQAGLSSGLLWALSAWGLLHMAGGLVPMPQAAEIDGKNVLYSLWLIPGRLKYDQVVHAYGFCVTTLVCWHVLHHTLRDPQGQKPFPSTGRLILCMAAGCGFGAFNEVVEFIATLTIPDTNVGGYENTGWDLVANLVGTTVAAGMIRLRASRRE